MDTPIQSDTEDRRQFLARTLSGATSLCLACTGLVPFADAQESQTAKPFKERISEGVGMTYEQMFQFTYFHSQLAIALVALSKHFGKDKFIDILKTAIDDAWIQPETQKRFFGTLDKGFWDHILKRELIKDTQEIRIVKYTECLWAKTFRETGEADIGYAVICHPDYAMARSKKQSLVRTKCQMLGDDCCYFQYNKQT